jgi:hypothetical protein
LTNKTTEAHNLLPMAEAPRPNRTSPSAKGYKVCELRREVLVASQGANVLYMEVLEPLLALAKLILLGIGMRR